jgi:hypothetical protein
MTDTQYIEKYVGWYGECNRKMITEVLVFLSEKEPTWDIHPDCPIDREECLDLLLSHVVARDV